MGGNSLQVPSSNVGDMTGDPFISYSRSEGWMAGDREQERSCKGGLTLSVSNTLGLMVVVVGGESDSSGILTLGQIQGISVVCFGRAK